ncbi:MAG: DUF3102 domain-containing protein [Opitutaceae bacterium]
MTALQPDNTVAIDLSAQINAIFAEARAVARTAADHARQAIAKAIECGGLLQRQKDALPHGAWQPWLAANCPNISASTARRYMRLAKRSHLTVLQDAATLQQAYLATGVLPESTRHRTPSSTAPTVSFVRGLDQFRRWFNRRTEEQPIHQWSPEARRLLRNELEWFKRLHDQLVS